MSSGPWVIWTNDHNGAQLQICTIPKNFKWWQNVENLPNGFRYMHSAKSGPCLCWIWNLLARGHAHMRQIVKQPRCCITTGVDHSIDTGMVPEIWILQGLDSSGTVFEKFLAHEEAHMAQMGKWPRWYNFESRQFHRNSNGENLSSDFRDMRSAMSGTSRPPGRPPRRAEGKMVYYIMHFNAINTTCVSFTLYQTW